MAATNENSGERVNAVLNNNIRKLTRLRAHIERRRSLPDRIAASVTDNIGSMNFIYFHIVLFAIWIVINNEHWVFKPFDPYPHGLLSLIVALEAVFLTVFILISQNRIGQEEDRRLDLDLQINLLTEYELTRVLRMLSAIQDKLGIVESEPDVLKELMEDVAPEDVFAAIDKRSARLTRSISVLSEETTGSK